MGRKIVKTPDKVGFEFVAIFALVFFLFISVWKCGDQSITWKLLQLCIATFSSGMLVHSWVRWQILINSDNNNEQNSDNGNFTGIIWPFWLTLSLLAWTIFGQDLLWDITATYSSGDTFHSGGTQKIASEFDSGVLGAYVTGLTVVVAIVTGFYLSMLHSATKYARESAKEARESVDKISENKKKIDELESEQSDTDRMVQFHLKFLNERFLLPNLDDLEFLMSISGENEDKQKNIEKRISLLRAEVALFNVIESENREQFLQQWNDVAAYKEDVFSQHDYNHLFRLARERLETLCQECSPKQQEQVAELKESIRSYEKQR